MKAKELRIGNHIGWNHESNDILNVEGLDKLAIKVTGHHIHSIGSFKPIPITEQWLLDFGFERNGNEFKTDWFLGISFDVIENDFHVYEIRDSFHITTIKYVHQLQNLYFALTGEELTKK